MIENSIDNDYFIVVLKSRSKGEKMQFSGKYIIKAPRLKVWEALNDEKILKETIFGCEKISWISKDELEIEIMVNFGVMKKSFSGDLKLSNIDPAVKYSLSGKGRGGILGKVHANADIELKDDGNDTYLEFNAKGGGSNALMSLGKSIIGSSAQRIIDRFFERFAQAMQVEIISLSKKEENNHAKLK
jgi:hypothetical protein